MHPQDVQMQRMTSSRWRCSLGTWDLCCDCCVNVKWLPAFGCAPHFRCFSPCARMRKLEGTMHSEGNGTHAHFQNCTREEDIILLALILESCASYQSSCQASDLHHISCIALSRSFVLLRVLSFCLAFSLFSAFHVIGVWQCPHSDTSSLSHLSSLECLHSLHGSSCHLFPTHLSLLWLLGAATMYRGSRLCSYK